MKNEKAPPKVTRRDFIKTTAAASFGAQIIGCSKRARKPNLLFIWTDEQRADTRTVVTRDGWKLCLSDKDKNQLFNLNNDPLETANIFDSAAQQPVVSRLTKKIEQWQERVDDDAVVL